MRKRGRVSGVEMRKRRQENVRSQITKSTTTPIISTAPSQQRQYLQILADVGGEHGFDALERVLDGERAEEVDEPLGVKEVGVDDGPLDVVQIGVVLEGALEQSRLFAELSHVGFVVVREHLVAQDGVRDLRRKRRETH